MPEQNEKNLPKAPAFNPKVKETIAAFKENNNPKNLNDTCRASPPPSRRPMAACSCPRRPRSAW